MTTKAEPKPDPKKAAPGAADAGVLQELLDLLQGGSTGAAVDRLKELLGKDKDADKDADKA